MAAAVVAGGEPLWKLDLPTPVGLVLGSEGAGIRPGLLKHVDVQLTLPMAGAALSYNVAVACALLAYELVRQRAAHNPRGS